MKKKKIKKWLARWAAHLPDGPPGPPGPRGPPGTCGPAGPPGMVNWGEFEALDGRVRFLENADKNKDVWGMEIQQRVELLERAWGKRVRAK